MGREIWIGGMLDDSPAGEGTSVSSEQGRDGDSSLFYHELSDE